MSLVSDIEAWYAKTEAYFRSFPVTPVPEKTRALIDGFLRYTDPASSQSTNDIHRQKSAKVDERLVEFCRVVYENQDEPYQTLRSYLSFGKSADTVNTVRKHALQNDYAFEFQRPFLKTETGRPPSRFGLLPNGFKLIDKKPHGNGKGPKQAPFVRHLCRYFESQHMLTNTETFYNRPDITIRGLHGEEKWLSAEVSCLRR